MGLMGYIGKKVTKAAGDVVFGATNEIVGTVSKISKNAASGALDIRDEVSKKNIENSSLKSKAAEEKLQKLKSLLDSELITQNEYDQKKAKLIKDL